MTWRKIDKYTKEIFEIRMNEIKKALEEGELEMNAWADLEEIQNDDGEVLDIRKSAKIICFRWKT